MMVLQSVTYSHPNREILFSSLSFSLSARDKIALIGDNGAGKSTLLRILAGDLLPSEGSISSASEPYYVPQLTGQLDHYSVARALGINSKINALKEILSGNPTEANLALIENDWTIEERYKEAFAHWYLEGLDLEVYTTTGCNSYKQSASALG